MASKLRWFNGKKVLKFLGYFFFVLVLTFVFTYLTLPFEKIKTRFLALAETQMNADIVGKIDTSWFTGLSIKNLRITPRTPAGEKAQEFEIEEGSVRLSILPLFLGRLQVAFSLKLAVGEVSGRFTRKKDGNEVEVTLAGVDLKTLPFLKTALGGKQLDGVVSGSAAVFLASDATQSSGKLDIGVDGVKLGSFQVPIAQWGNAPFTVPELNLGNMKADVEIADGAAVFKELKFSGSQDIEASAEGYALLRQPLAQSELRTYLKFKFSDGFFQRNPKFSVMQSEATLKSAERPDKFYGFLVEGNLGQPQFIRRTPMPNPPPNMTPPKGAAAKPPGPAGPGGPGVPGVPGGPGGPPDGPPGSARSPAAQKAFDQLNKRLGK